MLNYINIQLITFFRSFLLYFSSSAISLSIRSGRCSRMLSSKLFHLSFYIRTGVFSKSLSLIRKQLDLNIVYFSRCCKEIMG